MNYGEQGEDWLNLGGRRVNMPAKRVSNNIILGAVFLDREHSTDLVEKANREGFVENEAFAELVKAVLYALDKVETYRKTDKDLLRKHYGPQDTAQPVVTSIAELREFVGEKIKEASTQEDIDRYLVRIENEYERITETLLKSAGAGLNLIVVIHQIEKIIKDIKAMLKKKVSFEEIEERIKALSALVEGYSILVKKSQKKAHGIKSLLDQSVANVRFRLDDHHIKVLKDYSEYNALCSEDHMISALMNLFDNSIWWLKYAKVEQPQIYMNVSKKIHGYTTVIFADNGPGFTLSTDEIVKPFVTNKPDGMGIGLHLTQEIMKSLGGDLKFPNKSEAEDLNVPKGFLEGAIVALSFKEKEGEK
ncbi:MAG: HAMP domain-containing histidine kinase [Nitrospinae bacterium]|nr:HAMP domain-containing histidine kinase [Nitrospinota bacterium]